MWKTNNQSHHELANVKIPAVNHQKATTAAQYLLQHGALLRKKELAYQRNKRHSKRQDWILPPLSSARMHSNRDLFLMKTDK